ncbi:hypothetical protein [Salinilacihabitans rarus]|uniref:hypothetical protein n=1 Tax=Salinilacihabitans rarus TaxID=2961596 RepID=UPI0020C8A0E6|nr:hypothetical protein [Salinilacihabitans rarus]
MTEFRRWYTPVRFTIGIGLLFLISTFLIDRFLAGFQYGDGLAPTTSAQVWIFGGMILIGGISAFVSARYRIISPITITAGIYAGALAVSWSSMVKSAQSSGAGITPTWFDFVLWFWFLILAASLVAGVLEYKIRQLTLRDRSIFTV